MADHFDLSPEDEYEPEDLHILNLMKLLILCRTSPHRHTMPADSYTRCLIQLEREIEKYLDLALGFNITGGESCSGNRNRSRYCDELRYYFKQLENIAIEENLTCRSHSSGAHSYPNAELSSSDTDDYSSADSSTPRSSHGSDCVSDHNWLYYSDQSSIGSSSPASARSSDSESTAESLIDVMTGSDEPLDLGGGGDYLGASSDSEAGDPHGQHNDMDHRQGAGDGFFFANNVNNGPNDDEGNSTAYDTDNDSRSADDEESSTTNNIPLLGYECLAVLLKLFVRCEFMDYLKGDTGYRLLTTMAEAVQQLSDVYGFEYPPSDEASSTDSEDDAQSPSDDDGLSNVYASYLADIANINFHNSDDDSDGQCPCLRACSCPELGRTGDDD